MDDIWKQALAGELSAPYFNELCEWVRAERQRQAVFPPRGQVFNAFTATPLDSVRVLILGQDPYHSHGQAHGLSFSVPHGVQVPPSLRNIYRELQDDLSVQPPGTGNLLGWAQQGVLLLNSVLTVRAHEAGSHRGRGWETFTDAVIRLLGERETPMVFVLWGSYAREKLGLIPAHHTIVQSAHPSPLSADRGFFGSRPFTQVNRALAEYGHAPIDWTATA